MIEYIRSYLSSDQTPGAAGNMFWAAVYILLVFLGLSVAVIAVLALAVMTLLLPISTASGLLRLVPILIAATESSRPSKVSTSAKVRSI